MINLDDRLLNTLTGEEIGLFVHILKRVGAKKTSWPSRKLLKKETGYGREKLAKCIKGLIDKKIISTKQMNKGGSFGNIEYTIETRFAGVFISAQGHTFEEEQHRDTETRNTDIRDTETRTLSINNNKVLKRKRSINKIKLHSQQTSSTGRVGLKRKKWKQSSSKMDNTPKLPKPNKPSIKERNVQFLPIAKRLANIILQTKEIKTPPHRLKQWTNEIRKLHEMNSVSTDRMENVLDWYEENIGLQYTPVVESGASFREKFTRLEDAKQRSKQIPKRKGVSYGTHQFGKKVDFSKLQTKNFNDETTNRRMAS